MWILHVESLSLSCGVLFPHRKCRRPLATSSSLLPHPPGRGKVFGTNSLVINRSLDAIRGRGKGGRGGGKSRIEEKEDDSGQVCQEGLFFEPVQWMKDQILFLEGKAGQEIRVKHGTEWH